MTDLIDSSWSNIAGWDLHPLRNASLAGRTPIAVIHCSEIFSVLVVMDNSIV